MPLADEYIYGWSVGSREQQDGFMTGHESYRQDTTGPARDYQAIENVMKAVLLVVAVAGVAVVLYMVFFIGIFAIAS